MSIELKVLDPEKDVSAWEGLVLGLSPEYRDVFLLPGYTRVYAKLYAGRAGLFYLKEGDSSALHIYLTRPIKDLPFFASAGIESGYSDIISPEYSGPIIQCSPEKKAGFLRLFWQEFNKHCLQQKIVAEFGRLNPFYNKDKDYLDFVSAHSNRKVVCIDLSLNEKLIWKDFSKGNKSSIKKAAREGIIVKKTELDRQGIFEFYRLYRQTMQRNLAKEFYYFSEEFFADLVSNLKGNVSLFTAIYKDKTAAASLFVHLGGYVHYYFSGSDEAYLNLCPNNLLLYEAIKWAKASGFRVFNLGGGYHNDGSDSLFSFKSSFSAKSAGFYTYSRIHDEKIYRQLAESYCKFAAVDEKDADGSFFPLYRR